MSSPSKPSSGMTESHAPESTQMSISLQPFGATPNRDICFSDRHSNPGVAFIIGWCGFLFEIHFFTAVAGFFSSGSVPLLNAQHGSFSVSLMWEFVPLSAVVALAGFGIGVCPVTS